jgi:hypothetical protein
MNKKVIISIPVHEQPLVVKNHLENILKFVPNSSVILHASGDNSNFQNEIKEICKQFDEFAYVNETSYPTHSPNDAGYVTNLSSVHAINFKYISKIITDFDIFALETSNNLFVRKGVERLFNNYECGCTSVIQDVDVYYRDCHPNFRPFVDVLKNVIPVKTIIQCSQEGTFYKKEVFQEVSNVVLNKIGGLVKCEELILHSIAFNLFPELVNSNVGETYVFHDARDYATKEQDIIDVANGKYENKYVVKRVPRTIDNPCRNFINNLTKNI